MRTLGGAGSGGFWALAPVLEAARMHASAMARDERRAKTPPDLPQCTPVIGATSRVRFREAARSPGAFPARASHSSGPYEGTAAAPATAIAAADRHTRRPRSSN